MRSMKILALSLLLLSAIGVGAQRRSPATKKAETAAEAQKKADAIIEEVRQAIYIHSAFDASLEKLPPHFYGNDPESFLPKLTRLAATQKRGCDRFEKTTECQDRLNDLYKVELVDGIHANDRVAFTAKAECKYEPDPEIIRCGPADSGLYYIGSMKPLTVKRDGTTYTILRSIELKPLQQNWSFGVKGHPPEWATGHFDHLAYVLVGEFNEPFLETGIDGYSTTGLWHASIIFDLKEVWLVEPSTGEVLYKKGFAF